MTFSPDGRRLAVGSSAPAAVVVWDVSDPAGARRYGAPISLGSFIQLLEFHPTGDALITSASDETYTNRVNLWDVRDPGGPRPLGGEITHGGEVAFHAGARLLATDSSQPFADDVTLWDLTDPSVAPRRIPQTLSGAEGSTSLLQFSADGSSLALGSNRNSGGTVRFWDVTDRNHPRPFEQPRASDGTVSAGSSGSDTYPVLDGPLVSVTFLPGRNAVATVSGSDRVITLWDLTDPAAPRKVGQPIDGTSGNARTVALLPDGRTAVTGRADGTMMLWDLTDPGTPRRLGQPLTGTSPVTSLAWFPDPHSLSVGRSDGSVTRHDLADPTRATPADPVVPPPGRSGSEIAFAPEGGLLAVSGPDMPVTVMDPRSPSRRGEIAKPYFDGKGGDGVGGVLGFSPDGRLLAVGVTGWGSYVTLWDVSDPARPHRVGPRLDPLDFFALVAFSPDGRMLASRVGAGSSPGVDLIDISDPARPRKIGETLTGHTDGVRSVAFSADGHMVATGSSDRSIVLWDVADPEHPHRIGLPLTGHTSDVVSVAFSPDGSTLATGGDDGKVILWDLTDVARPRELGAPLAGHNRLARSLLFSPDGRTLVTGDADGTVIAWDLAGLDALRANASRLACARAGRGLDRDEWARYVGGLSYQDTCG